jgi:hypothetical protein
MFQDRVLSTFEPLHVVMPEALLARVCGMQEQAFERL